MLVGDAIAEVDERGQPIRDDTLLVLANADAAPIRFTLPSAAAARPGRSCSTRTAAASCLIASWLRPRTNSAAVPSPSCGSPDPRALPRIE